MDAGFGIMMAVAMLGSQISNLVMQTPPRDLVSLAQTKMMLPALNVETDNASLIALLKGNAGVALQPGDIDKAVVDLGAAAFQVRKAAAEKLRAIGQPALPALQKAATSDDPEVAVTARGLVAAIQKDAAPPAKGDLEYVKKILAIRLLEKRKSRAAVPQLQAVAKGVDVTLAAAAAEALAVIGGKPFARKPALPALKALALLLPVDAGFVLMADFTTGAVDKTVVEYFDELKELAGKDPKLKQVLPQLAIGMPFVGKGLQMALAQVGNVRVDSVTVVVPKDVDTDNQYFGGVLKGLYDPTRVAALLSGEMQTRKLGELTVYYERSGLAVCLLDKHTLVIGGGDTRDGTAIDPILKALASKPQAKPSWAAAKALELVAIDGTRLAAAGALTDRQKATIKQEMNREVQRGIGRIDPATGGIATIDRAMPLLGLQLAEVERFTGSAGIKGSMTITAQCPDKAKAAALANAVTVTEAAARAFLAEEMQGNGMEATMMKAMLPMKDGKLQPMLKATVKDKGVIIRSDVLPAGMMMGMPMMMLGGRAEATMEVIDAVEVERFIQP
jgi:hypothetical protein